MLFVPMKGHIIHDKEAEKVNSNEAGDSRNAQLDQLGNRIHDLNYFLLSKLYFAGNNLCGHCVGCIRQTSVGSDVREAMAVVV